MTPEIKSQVRAIISPPPRLKISERADQAYFIPKEGNAEPGKYHLKRMPWQRDMLDDPLDPSVQEIFWKMCSQYAGKTLCGSFIVQYRIEQQKESTIMVYPTIKSAKRWMMRKFQKILDATPCMNGLVGNPRNRADNSTALEREFPGGALTGLGANSTSDFRGTTASGVLQDEIDDYEDDKDEGDPCALADRAAETFANPLKLKYSTPTLAGFSRIDNGYESGDKQKYFVPCPCCGHMQHLQTERMKFSFTEEEYAKIKIQQGNFGVVSQGTRSDEHSNAIRSADTSESRQNQSDSPRDKDRARGEIINHHTWAIGKFAIIDTEKTIYVCEKCQKGWTDAQRIAAIMSGHEDNPPIIPLCSQVENESQIAPLRAEWRATAPFKGIRSRHLNGMYAVIGLKQSFKSYLHMFADKFLKAVKGGRAKLQAWTNTFKAEVFEDEMEAVEYKDLLDTREDYGPTATIAHIPDMICLILFTADNQADRVEITSWGFGDQHECWVLDHKVIYGDMDMQEMRDRVGDYLVNKRFTHRFLGEMAYEMGLFDSAFQKSQKVKAVYRFCQLHASRQYFAIRGSGNMGSTIYNSRIEHAFRIRIFNLNSDLLKDSAICYLRNRIKAGKDTMQPESIHFPNRPEFNEKYFAGMCSEKCYIVRMANGGSKRTWRKVTSSARNEPWDLFYYALGGFEILRHAGKVEWIARKTIEIKRKLELLEPSKPTEMKMAVESVTPEVKPIPVKQPQRNPWRKIGGDVRRGTWNPLKL